MREGERARANERASERARERESARARERQSARDRQTDGSVHGWNHARAPRARARAHTDIHACTRTAPANPALMTPEPLSTTIGADAMSSSCTASKLWANAELLRARAQSAETGRGARAGGGQSTADFGCRAFAPEVRLCALPLPSSCHLSDTCVRVGAVCVCVCV